LEKEKPKEKIIFVKFVSKRATTKRAAPKIIFVKFTPKKATTKWAMPKWSRHKVVYP